MTRRRADNIRLIERALLAGAAASLIWIYWGSRHGWRLFPDFIWVLGLYLSIFGILVIRDALQGLFAKNIDMKDDVIRLRVGFATIEKFLLSDLRQVRMELPQPGEGAGPVVWFDLDRARSSWISLDDLVYSESFPELMDHLGLLNSEAVFAHMVVARKENGVVWCRSADRACSTLLGGQDHEGSVGTAATSVSHESADWIVNKDGVGLIVRQGNEGRYTSIRKDRLVSISYLNIPYHGPMVLLNALHHRIVVWQVRLSELPLLCEKLRATLGDIRQLPNELLEGSWVFRPWRLWLNASVFSGKSRRWHHWVDWHFYVLIGVLLGHGLHEFRGWSLVQSVLAVPASVVVGMVLNKIIKSWRAFTQPVFSNASCTTTGLRVSDIFGSVPLDFTQCGCLTLESADVLGAGARTSDLVHWFDRSGIVRASIERSALLSPSSAAHLAQHLPGFCENGLAGTADHGALDLWVRSPGN